MKKILTVMLLAAFAVTAQGQQPDSRLTQLDEYFRQQGYTISISQQNWGSGVQCHTGTHPIQFMDLGEKDTSPEGLNRAKKRKEMKQLFLDSIRIAFAKLGKESTESYMYEYHKNDKDTIKYSYKNTIPDNNSREFASFDFRRSPRKSNDSGNNTIISEYLLYSHFSVIPTGIAKSDMIAFDGEAFNSHIQPVIKKFMQLEGAKSYPVHWQHDEGFDKDGDFEPWHHNEKQAGISTGTHYYIPSEHKDEVQTLFRELISLSHDYVNKHPEQFYMINLYPAIPVSAPGNVVSGPSILVQGENNKGKEVFHMSCASDKNGYHVFSCTIKGVGWIPSECTSLKSYINGKKVYIKGMEPKKEKK